MFSERILLTLHTMKELIVSLLGLFNEMSPFLLLGFLFAGILHVSIPKRFYHRYLSDNGFRSVVYASLFGIPLPLCSCGVLPTAMSLRREGASKAATTSFLTSTPQTGVDSILATYSVFGLPFAIVRPLAALVTGLLSGFLVSKYDRDSSDDPSVKLDEHDHDSSASKSKVFQALKYGFFDMLQDIGGHLCVGLVVAGIISVAIPDEFFLRFSSYPLLQMLAIMLIATPMYVCATGSIPIAAALMLKGLNPGAALVFLMAGPAVNMASLLVIKKVMGARNMAIYVSTIIAGAFAFGLAIDYLMPREWFGQVSELVCYHEGTTPLWQWCCSGLFMALLLHALLSKWLAPYHHHEQSMDQSLVHASKEVVYRIEGMKCTHCQSSLEEAVLSLEGVEQVQADRIQGTLRVMGKADSDTIKSVVDRLGFKWLG